MHGKSLTDAQMLAESMADEDSSLMLLQPHDDERAIAGQATVGLEVVRQHGAAMVSGATGGQLRSSMPSSSASAAARSWRASSRSCRASSRSCRAPRSSASSPTTSDVLNRSLLSGHPVSLPEPGHFVDGAAVRQVGPEVFRVCNELVDDLVTVFTATSPSRAAPARAAHTQHRGALMH